MTGFSRIKFDIPVTLKTGFKLLFKRFKGGF